MAFAVLIADDSPVMRTFIRRVMNLAGCDAAGYVEAADVILTDINMPGMGGEELLQELDRNGTLLSTPAGAHQCFVAGEGMLAVTISVR